MSSTPSADRVPAYDLFLDLTGSIGTSEGLDRYLTVLERRIPLASGQRVTATIAGRSLIVRRDRRFNLSEGGSALGQALELAHLERRGLFVIKDAWIPDQSALDAIAELAAIDTNIGTIQPRFAVGGSGDVLVLPSSGKARGLLPRPLVGMLPEFFVTPELDAACIYITQRGVPGFDSRLELPFADRLIALRRRGFRNLVANRVIVDYPYDPELAYPISTDTSESTAEDRQGGRDWFSRSPLVKLERLLIDGMSDGRKRLLLDCRGMTPAHNGSAHSMLGYLEGLSRLGDSEWDVTVSVGRRGAEFHGLARRFPQFRYEYDRPQSKFLVAIHLNQPWSPQMLVELHEAAPLVAFNILDTIAWDAIYPAPRDLDAVTRFAARFADGLTYLSEHSRLRFRFRFVPHPAMREAVSYLSMDRADYGANGRQPVRQGIGILVVGNRFDHKDVERTTNKLAEAFPFTPIVAFGTNGPHASPNVRSVPSGLIDEASVRDLFERANVIVYPSFSEGFGLPVVRGLALGKRVVARDLPLWDEIRHKSQMGERLAQFHSDAELVEAVGHALREVDSPSAGPLNTSAAPSSGWEQCAKVLLDFANGLVQDFSYDHWQGRDLAVPSLIEREPEVV